MNTWWNKSRTYGSYNSQTGTYLIFDNSEKAFDACYAVPTLAITIALGIYDPNVIGRKGHHVKKSNNKILDKDQIEKIHKSAVKILEEIGTDIFSEKAMEILCSGGAKKVGKRTVKIPEKLVEAAINSAAKKIDIR